MCGSGYVLAVDNTCIMCFGGCVLCDMNDPTVCVSCGNGLYLKDNYCFVCSVNCRSCSSNVVCTSCVSGSYLRNGICSDISTSLLACTKKNSIEGCLACVEGYTIINGQCSGYCPDGQYPTIL